MGLFDTLKGLAGGALGGDAQQAMSGALDNSSVGGVSGMLGMLEQNGLGSAVASWVPGGDHCPISPDQLQAVLGDAHVQSLANQFGVSPDEVLAHLSQHLPALAAAQQAGDS
ncbi:MAG: YidB family protein [Caulobacteraceae bacterium]